MHQYWIDQAIKMEEDRLNWIRKHQHTLKAEVYKNLAEAVRENEGRQAGKYFVLPSSFVGSPRHNMQNYQDAMAIVRGELYDCATIQSRVAFVIPYAMMMDDVWIITLSCNMRVMTCMLLFTSMCHILSALHRTWSPRLLHHHDLQS